MGAACMKMDGAGAMRAEKLQRAVIQGHSHRHSAAESQKIACCSHAAMPTLLPAMAAIPTPTVAGNQ